jgi:hypothetical protein
MYHFVSWLSLTAVLLMSTGCSHQASSPLFPLETGLYWRYEIEKQGETKQVQNWIANSRTIGPYQWFLSVEYGERFWIRNSLQGQVEAVNLYKKKYDAPEFEKLDPKTIHQELLFKYPATPGDTWIMLENTIRYEGLQTLTVPAGTFDCHQYSITQYGQTYSHSCIAEGIGVIYSDNQLPDGQWETSRLLDWGKFVPPAKVEEIDL